MLLEGSPAPLRPAPSPLHSGQAQLGLSLGPHILRAGSGSITEAEKLQANPCHARYLPLSRRLYSPFCLPLLQRCC